MLHTRNYWRLFILFIPFIAACTVVGEAPATVGAPPLVETAVRPTDTPPIPTPFLGTPQPEFSNPFHQLLGATPAPEGWQVAPCDGEAAVLCIYTGTEFGGFAELLTFPLENQEGMLEGLAEAGLTLGNIDVESEAYQQAAVPALERFAANHLAFIEADREITFGDSYRFVPQDVEAIQFGALPGVVFGFTGEDEAGNVLERYITYVAFDDASLYLLGATSDPAAVPHFLLDEDLVMFIPYLNEIVAGLNLPLPTPAISFENWQEIEGEFVTFAVPEGWQPTQQPLSGGAVLEMWHLGIPGAESDQMLGFSAVAFEQLRPSDILLETGILIDGKPGAKWIRGGENYVSYDYYTEGLAGDGSFGLHVTLGASADEIEKALDQLVQSVEFK